MREEVKNVQLDNCEEGAVITALDELRKKEANEQESTDFLDELILKVIHSPSKKVRVRNNEAR